MPCASVSPLQTVVDSVDSLHPPKKLCPGCVVPVTPALWGWRGAGAARSAHFVSNRLLGEKSVSWDIPSGWMGMRADKGRERGSTTALDSLSKGNPGAHPTQGVYFMARHCARVLLLAINASAWVLRRVNFSVRSGKIFTNKGKIYQPEGITSHCSHALSLSILPCFPAALVLLQKAECTAHLSRKAKCSVSTSLGSESSSASNLWDQLTRPEEGCSPRVLSSYLLLPLCPFGGSAAESGMLFPMRKVLTVLVLLQSWIFSSGFTLFLLILPVVPLPPFGDL